MRWTRWASTAAFLAVLWPPGLAEGQTGGTNSAILPEEIPLFPLPDVALFPSSIQPFHIFEPRYRAMVADALASDSIIGMILLRPGYEADYEGRPPIYSVGCAGVIVASELLPDGRYNIVVDGFTRFRVLSEDASRAYRLAEVVELPEEVDAEDRAELTLRRRQLEDAVRAAAPNAQLPPAELSDERAIDGLSIVLPLPPAVRQELLETDGPMERASRLIELLRGGRRAEE